MTDTTTAPTDATQSDADALTTAVARMARVGNCTAPSFSPDGSRLAFVSDLNGIPQVWTVAAGGGWPELVTALDDQISAVRWSPDGAWLAFLLAPGGGMNQQVYLVRPDGGDLRRLTAGGKETNWLGPWTHDGRALTLASNQRNPATTDAYLVDAASGAMRLVAANQGIGTITDISRDGRWAVLNRVRQRSDNDLFLIDLTNGTEIRLTPHEAPGSFGNGTFSPDGRTLYLASNKDRELIAFARLTLDAEGRPGPIEVIAARDDAELQEFAISEDGTTAALVWNAGGRSDLAFLDLASGATTPGPALPAEIALGITFSQDGKQLAMTVLGAAEPVNIWVCDREAVALRQVTHSPHAGIELAALVRPELVQFAGHGGLPLTGWLYRAPGATEPGPTVLSFHGGPEAQERPVFNGTFQALLGQGIAVFAPNVRGSSGFGKTFVNLDNGALRVNAVRDIQACVDYVVGAGIADPARIGIMGGSYGGYMTMAGLTEFPDLFAAGANWFGIVNFETFFAHTEPWMAAVSKVEYGDPDTEVDLLRRLSPIHKLDRVRAATIVLHGANDTNCPVVEAEQVVDHLKARAVPVEYVLFPDEGHGFRKTPNRIRAVVETVRWFATHLKAGAPPTG